MLAMIIFACKNVMIDQNSNLQILFDVSDIMTQNINKQNKI